MHTLSITVEFPEDVNYSPGTEEQLDSILGGILKSKGIDYQDRVIKLKV